MNSKNPLISFLQAWGITLVVIGHCFRGGNIFHTWIYTFHMPLFMFISGYLLRYGIQRKKLALSDTKAFGQNGFLLKKAKRLLIPWATISSLVYLPKVMLSHFAIRPIDLSLESYINMFIYPPRNVIGPYWFLPTIFLIFTIVLHASKISKALGLHIPEILVMVVLVILNTTNILDDIEILGIQDIAHYLVYFVGGYYCCRKNLMDYLRDNATAYLLLCFSVSIILLASPPFIGKSLLAATIGIAMSTCLGYVYLQKNWSFFNHIYGKSYTIYLLSWFPQVISIQFLVGACGAPMWLGSLLAGISGIYIPLIIYNLTTRIKDKKIGRTIALIIGQ